MKPEQDEIWGCLPYSAQPADLQLAAGDALLAELEEASFTPAAPLSEQESPGALATPLLRWYSIRPRALILGVGQKIHEFDLDACRKAGIKLHRRSSGGTAVLAEPDQIMLDIALPPTHRLYRQDVTESYRWLGEVWVLALAKLGFAAHLITTPEARADTQTLDALTRKACYGGRSPYEVLIDERKIVGLAQVRRRAGALLQTGIYTHWSPQLLVNLLALSETERESLGSRLTARVAGLAEVEAGSGEASRQEDEEVGDGRGLLPAVMQAFATALRDLQGVALVDGDWSKATLERRSQVVDRYAAIEE